MALTRIHVNQHVIRKNHKEGRIDPVLTVKSRGKNIRTNEATIIVNGKIVARVVYRPDKPLPCGAKCWVETYEEVRTD